MEMYKTYERGEERHHAKCDHCGKTIYPSHNNPFLFYGFMCKDTNLFISNDCKKDYYLKKNNGFYGYQHKNKYSEVPIQVPWEKIPRFVGMNNNLYGIQLSLF